MMQNHRMETIRGQFPILDQRFPVMGGAGERPLIYLDHGASTHPPRRVIDVHREFLEKFYSNIHRGNHNLSMIASDMFDRVEEIILGFIGADTSVNTAILCTNTTGALDLAAYVMSAIEGATISTTMEHHSNFLPHRRHSETILAGCLPDGSLDLDDLEAKLKSRRVKLVAVTGASNVTGFMPDIHKIARMAHSHGARILVDGAQLLAHQIVDVKANENPEHIDFFAAAGHKAYAPFGSAFLMGPRELFDAVPPYIPGGGTVDFVTPDEAIWSLSPDRHQGGTPNIPGAIAMAEAINFLDELGMDWIRRHEQELFEYTVKGLEAIPGVTVYGPKDPRHCIGVISFNVEGIPNELASAILNYEAGIATRNGCFCAHPYIQHLMKVKDPMGCKVKFDKGEIPFLPGAVRATIGVYNTRDEMDQLLDMVEIISRHQWKGDYDLSATSQCRPIAFRVRGQGSGQATCVTSKSGDEPDESDENEATGTCG